MNLKTKVTVYLVVFLLLSGVSGLVSQAQAAVEVNIGFFYEQLTPYGTWVQIPTFGWAWYPHNMAVGWRPYTVGHWVYTDDYGWTWVSDEEWGWATYHYGRWLLTERYGWVWVPGYVWGPAWVAWRTGGGYIGWAPLPPQIGWRAGIGLEFGKFSIDLIPAQRWIFVRDRNFLASEIHRNIIIAPRNVTVIKITKNVTRIVPVDGRIVDRSISVRDVERTTGKRVQVVRVKEVGKAGELRAARGRAGEVVIFRPKIERAPANVTPKQFQTLEGRHKAERATYEEKQKAERANLGRQHAIEQQGDTREEAAMRQRHAEERATIQEKQRAEAANLNRRQKLEGRASSFGQEEERRRQQAETSTLQKRQQVEVTRQEQRMKAEQGAAGSRREEMLRRQDSERKALESENAQQARVLENRQAQERAPQVMSSEKAKPESRQARERTPQVKSTEKAKSEQGKAQGKKQAPSVQAP